jgi:hypothetical protein
MSINSINHYGNVGQNPSENQLKSLVQNSYQPTNNFTAYPKSLVPTQQNKSQDEYEEEDYEVDQLGFEEDPPYERQNEGIVSNLALANLNQDIEEIEPQLGDTKEVEKRKIQ